MLSSNRNSKQKALEFIANTTWSQVQAMGIKNFLKRVQALLPKHQKPITITRLPKSDGSHINGPSNAVEGYPINTNHELQTECFSSEVVSSGYHWGSCSYVSSATVCHRDAACNWSCTSAQTYESTC